MTNSAKTLFGAAVAAFGGWACGPIDTICESGDQRPECNSSDTNPVTKITVTPDGELREVDLTKQVEHVICYKARAQFKNGNGADITTNATWTSDRPDLGSFKSPPCYTTSTTLVGGGQIKIQASLGGGTVKGQVTLVIKVRGTGENDGVTATQFSGPVNSDGNARPEIVYPLNDSMHPRNIDRMNLQFYCGAGNQVYRATFISSQIVYNLYFKPTSRSGDQCQWHVPRNQWKLIAQTNNGTTVDLAISGADGSMGGRVAASSPIKIAFSPEDVLGGLYYFSTSLPGILRLAFSMGAVADQATPFVIPSTTTPPFNSPSNPRKCSGCHAITQNGDKIAATYGSGDDFLAIAKGADADQFVSARPPDVAAKTRCGTGDTCSNFQWFNKEGNKLISNFDGALILRDGDTAAELARVPKTDIHPTDAGRQRAVMPEWSHQGDRIVFVRLLPSSGSFYQIAQGFPIRPGGDWMVSDAGEIAILPYNDGQFGAAKVLVSIAEGNREFHYYPTFSPDDKWIVFNTGTSPGFSPVAQGSSAGFSYGIDPNKLVSYDQQSSRLRMVSSTGGSPIELARATYAPNKTSSWPKFTPFEQRSGKLMFFTFSAKMDYGFVVTGGNLPQVWMSAIDLSRLSENQGDPSFAPFWLPFQDEKQANHLTIWTTKIACEGDNKCQKGEFCEMGKCVVVPG